MNAERSGGEATAGREAELPKPPPAAAEAAAPRGGADRSRSR